MTVQNVNIDYCGIITLLKNLVQIGKCTEKEAQKIASYLCAGWCGDHSVSLIFVAFGDSYWGKSVVVFVAVRR